MPRLLSLLRVLVRAIATALLVIGVLIWLGQAGPWRNLHVSLGFLLALTMLALGVAAARLTGRWSTVLVVLVWTAFVVAFGLVHGRYLPGDAHWVVQLLHVVTGLATIGLAEGIAGRALRSVAPASA